MVKGGKSGSGLQERAERGMWFWYKIFVEAFDYLDTWVNVSRFPITSPIRTECDLNRQYIVCCPCENPTKLGECIKAT